MVAGMAEVSRRWGGKQSVTKTPELCQELCRVGRHGVSGLSVMKNPKQWQKTEGLGSGSWAPTSSGVRICWSREVSWVFPWGP